MPLQTTVATSPDAPELVLAEATSSSSVRFSFTEPNSRGLPIDAYKVEWSSDESFGTAEVIKLSIVSTSANDTYGSFNLAVGGETTTPLEWRTVTAADVESALDVLTTVGDVEVSQFSYEDPTHEGSTDPAYGLTWHVTFTQDIHGRYSIQRFPCQQVYMSFIVRSGSG